MDYYYGKQQALEAELDKAASYLDKAIHEDPNYIPAYVAYFETVDGSNNAHLDRLPKANDALMNALQMDETNVEAHLAMAGLLMQYEYNWPGAEKEYRRALELGPKAAEAHAQYANYLDDIGRTTEAAKERNLAQALDPSHDYFADAGVHRVGNTVDEDRKALDEKAPDDPYALAVMGKEYAIAGRFRESAEIWERSLALYGWKDFVNVLRRTDQKRDAKVALAAWMQAAEEYDKRHGNMPVVAMAFTYSSLGNKDRAFAWLDKAVEQRSWMIIYLKVDPVWDPLRSDPRFGALLRRVGLPL
jgi:serine/threonine-protein kinase